MTKNTDELLNEIGKSNDIHQYLSTNRDELIEQNVSKYLKELLDNRGIKISDIANSSTLSKSYIYQIFQGRRPNPSRNILLNIAFSLKLNLDETQKLLKIANVGILYPRIERDSIIIFAINKNIGIDECDNILSKSGLEVIVDDVK